MAAPRTTSKPTITVLYFAAASTAIGLTTEQVELPPAPRSDESGESVDNSSTSTSTKNHRERPGFPLSELAPLLAARHAHTKLGTVLEQSGWAVDAEMVEDPARVFLSGGEEVAVICPVSGG